MLNGSVVQVIMQRVATSFIGKRVVHATDYHLNKHGDHFFNWSNKIHQGLVQNGCYVYPFTTNDIARMLSLFGSKRSGMSKANASLLKTCKAVNPEVLLLGHAQGIRPETLAEIREELPSIKIGLWYVDGIDYRSDVQHLLDKLPHLDAFFATISGPALERFARPGCPSAFAPNPVEPSIERLRAFETQAYLHDILFIGRDKKRSERVAFLEEIEKLLPPARLGVYGSLGQPRTFGKEKDLILAGSRMGLNYSIYNDTPLGTSDRISALIGNGLLVLCPESIGYHELFSEEEMVFFIDADDLAEKVSTLLADEQKIRQMAERGWLRAHELFSAQKVAEFMLLLMLEDTVAQDCPWANHVFNVN